jgi:hypothetical protein
MQNNDTIMRLAICELYNPCIHGHDEASSPGINGHFLCSYIIPHDTEFNPREYPFIFLLQSRNRNVEWDIHNTGYWKQTNDGAALDPDVAASFLKYGHPLVRNYWNIIRKRGARMLELVKLVELEPGGECVCVLKTFWLRIFQRRIRTWIQNKKRVRQILKETRFLMLRECGMAVIS